MKYCSRRCTGIMGGARHLTLEQRRAGAEKSKQVRRAQAVQRLAGLTPLEILRRGISIGWKMHARRAAQRRV